jgi:outer membrane protein TolC
MGLDRKRRIIVTHPTNISLLALFTALSFTIATRTSSAQTATDAASFRDLIAAEVGTPGGLTADEVARRAARTSPTVVARNEDLLAAGAEVDRAVSAYVPQVSLQASYTRMSDTGSGSVGNIVAAPGAGPGPLGPNPALVNAPLAFETPLNQYGMQASISVPVSDYFLRVRPLHEGAKLGEVAAAEQLRAEKLKAAADGRLAYYDWVRARLNLIVAQQALSQAQAHLTDAQTGLAAGTLSQADVLRVESEVARSELLVTSTQNLSVLTEEQLRVSMHEPTAREYRIGEDVRKPAPTVNTTGLDDLWAEAQRSRPELRALDAQRGAQEWTTAYDKAGYAPRLDLVGSASYSNPNSRIFPQEAEFRGSWEAGARLTWIVSDVPATAATVRAGDARARSIAAERASVSDQIRLQVMSAYQDRAEARVAEQTTLRRLVSAEESYRTRRLLFQNGRATTVELLDAETDLTRARLEAVDARIDGRVAEVRLAYAVGRHDRP